MDSKEALQILQSKFHIEGPIREVYKEVEAREVAVKALEKQIPVKTKIKINDEDVKVGRIVFAKGTKVHYCPQCQSAVMGSEHFCRNCGQALIW